MDQIRAGSRAFSPSGEAHQGLAAGADGLRQGPLAACKRRPVVIAGCLLHRVDADIGLEEGRERRFNTLAGRSDVLTKDDDTVCRRRLEPRGPAKPRVLFVFYAGGASPSVGIYPIHKVGVRGEVSVSEPDLKLVDRPGWA